VVGIQTGGRIPATLLSFHLGLPLYMLPINFRDENNDPRYGEPRVLTEVQKLPPAGARVLLADDVAVSGATLAKARELLPDYPITTFVMKGQADIVLFPEVRQCVHWPWLS
jgi:hypoxanthine phosphoribosyltransferase